MFDQNAERDWLEKLEKTHPSSILDLASDRALLPKLWLALAKVPGSQSKYSLKHIKSSVCLSVDTEMFQN